MVKFGELTESQKKRFSESVNKKPDKTYTEEEMMLWPEDDDEAVQNYFKNDNKE